MPSTLAGWATGFSLSGPRKLLLSGLRAPLLGLGSSSERPKHLAVASSSQLPGNPFRNAFHEVFNPLSVSPLKAAAFWLGLLTPNRQRLQVLTTS